MTTRLLIALTGAAILGAVALRCAQLAWPPVLRCAL